MPSRYINACDECRRRKSRCSKTRPSCSSCTEYKLECLYSGNPARSPLTRKHLTSVERKLQRLESILQSIRPDLDYNLDDLERLKTNGVRPTESQAPETSVSSSDSDTTDLVGAKTTEVQVSRHPVSKDRRAPSSAPLALLPEAVPEEASGFDWREKDTPSADSPSDGMVALLDVTGTGYMGSSSSVVLLRSLRLLGWDIRLPEGEELDLEDRQDSSPVLLPLSQQFASRHVMSSLIDSYFNVYHISYPFVHETTFRAQFHEVIARPSGATWDALLNAILALGAWILNPGNSDFDDHFYREALKSLQQVSILESGSLPLVQSLLLLSNYSQKRNKPNSGWQFLGLATRMAVSLGLHREFPKWKATLLEQEMRRRVWWGLFIFDSGASITFGRPILLPSSRQIDARLPLNVPEEELTSFTTSLPTDSNTATIYSCLLAQAQFHLISNPIYNRMMSTPALTEEEVNNLLKPLDSWFKNLPYYMRDESRDPASPMFFINKKRLFWRYWNFNIVILRRFFMDWAVDKTPSSDDGDLRNTREQLGAQCLQYAHLTIESIKDTVDGEDVGALGTWYGLYFLFQAALIHLIHVQMRPDHPDAHSSSIDVSIVKNILGCLASKSAYAKRLLRLVKQIVPTQYVDNTGIFDVFIRQSDQSNGPTPMMEDYADPSAWDSWLFTTGNGWSEEFEYRETA